MPHPRAKWMAMTRFVLALILLACVNPAPADAQGCDASPLLIRHANVWTPAGVQRDRDVLIRDGRIAAVEPARAERDGTTRTLDGAGHTLLPGLIDSHLHFSIPGGLPPATPPRT